MPHTKHRLCTWHISENALRHVKDPAFHPRLKRMMFHRFTEEGFVKEWNALIEEFGLQDNRWARMIFCLRKLWAITFLRGHFFAGMDTTQRCEGMNYFIKTKVDPNMKLSEFVRQIDLGLSWLRNDESKLDYETTNTLPPLGGTYFPDIERQAASVFTRALFFRVRNEMKWEGKYTVRSIIEEGDIVTTKFRKYRTTNVSRSVMFNTVIEEFYCECEGIPTNGIPCRHIFATMKSRNMNKIPNLLILWRWTVQAKIGEESRESYNPKCKYTCIVESARFGHIHNQGAEIAYYSTKNEDLFRLGNTHMEKVVNIIRTAWQEYTDDAKNKTTEAEKETEIDIRNPVFTKTKGTANCPTTDRKMVRRCSIYNKKGHNKTTYLRRETNTIDSPDLSLNLEDLSNNTVRLNVIEFGRSIQ
ncbi:FHY3/FAR1 family [Parasponia andersonii]|uniref:Protein FAR1-RELATED SEQUENCE n=1 Tax=Parasponia andersonii TaxID=3476 RepID=A0A2P5B1T5_PARAD|nr:FHY3/FAR1 family [Parasponia andersonii]